MSGEFLELAQQASGPDPGLSGVMTGQVIANCDAKRSGRVLVRLAARGGIEIWVRIALLDTGAYFMPQEGDEVLVAFNQGDGNEAFIIGRLWNESKQPPLQGAKDPLDKRVIRTPIGHEIALNETEQSVVITTGSGQYIEMTPKGVEIAVNKDGIAKITLDNTGAITISSTVSITLKSAQITLDATTLAIGSPSSTSIRIG